MLSNQYYTILYYTILYMPPPSLLLIGVDGKHKHELESPSFHNDAEVTLSFASVQYMM
jgi:hypothetical protein